MSSLELSVSAALGALIIAIAYVPPLDDSFWLDEAVTAWIARGDLNTTLEASSQFQGGTRLYNLIAWCVRSIWPTSEMAFRMPSVIGAVVGGLSLWRLGARLFDETTGLIAGLVFLALPTMTFAGTDARPYALAVAALVLSTLLLCRWIDERKVRDELLYAFFAASVVYLHYIPAIALLAHVPFFLVRRTEVVREIRWSEIARPLLLLFALLTPAGPQLLNLLRRSGYLEMDPQRFTSIVQELVPPGLLLPVLCGVVIGLVIFPKAPHWSLPKSASGLVLLIAWIVAPFGVLLGLKAAGVDLQVTRYFISTEPAIAMAAAVVISALCSTAVRWTAAGAGIMIFLLVIAPPPQGHTVEDWREAASVQRSLADTSTPTLFFSGLVEAQDVEWLSSPATAAYLNSPATTYQMEGKILAAPWEITPQTDAYLHNVAREHLLTTDEFLLMTRGRDVTRRWLDKNVVPRGFSVETSYAWNGTIFLDVYRRDK